MRKNNKQTPPLEKIAAKIAALGVPGLIFTVAVAATGLAGAAAITAALAALGPGGIVGGIAFLGVAGLISHAISEYGSELIVSSVIKELYLQGYSKDSLKEKVSRYWISYGLKLKLYDMIERFS